MPLASLTTNTKPLTTEEVKSVETFAEKLKKAKKAVGLTQQKMADLMLIPKRTIEEWERGNNVPPAYVQRFVLNELESLKK